jgi:hypothetical protein
MLAFERHSRGETDRTELAPKALIVAGWTGRDEKALHHHIEELAAIGVPRPSSVPVFYRISTANLTQVTHLEVLGTDTSGEAEPVVVAMNDGLWLGVGSDHTDRKAETMGIALSKQICAKVVGKTLWRLDDVADHHRRHTPEIPRGSIVGDAQSLGPDVARRSKICGGHGDVLRNARRDWRHSSVDAVYSHT